MRLFGGNGVRFIKLLGMVAIWFGLSGSVYASAQISVKEIEELSVELSWDTPSGIAAVQYQRDGNWYSVSVLSNGGEVATSHGGIKAPGVAQVTFSQQGDYRFRVLECEIFSVGTRSTGSKHAPICGSSRTPNGHYEGAIATTDVVTLFDYRHHDSEYADLILPEIIPEADSIVATPIDQIGGVRLSWTGSRSFVEIDQKIGSNADWQSVSVYSDVFPTVRPPNSLRNEIAPSGTVADYVGPSGVHQYRMRSCSYIAGGRYGGTIYRTCGDNIYSEPFFSESLGLSTLPPLVSFKAPEINAQTKRGESITVQVNVGDLSLSGSTPVETVEFYRTQVPGQMVQPSQKVHTATSAENGAYQYKFTSNELGDHYLVAVATNIKGIQGYAVSNVRVVDAPEAVASPNNSSPVDFSRYDIYYADLDDDGQQDIYFHGTPKIILLHGDIITPIQLPAPLGFAYFGNADGSYQPALPWDSADTFLDSCDGCMRAQKGAHYVLGDMDADGHEDILVKGRNGHVSSLLINGTEGQALPQVMLEILPTGQTRKPGQDASQSPIFSDNLSGSPSGAVTINNGRLHVNGAGYTLTNLQEEVSSEGAAQATNQKIPSAPQASLPTHSLSAVEIAEIDTVASIGGEFRVNEMGAAIYTVPLELPRGTAGVAPDIMLNYSSQSGAGEMGLGWSLAAGGGISRCRQTLQVDGQALPIQFNEEDRFCLDGQRLLAIQGKDGGVGTVYKPEVDNGVVVASKGGVNGHPSYFVATAQDGSTSIYGDSDHSLVRGRDGTGKLQTNRTMAWNLTEFSDSVGNKIIYTYDATVDFQRLKSVSYGVGATASADVVVNFQYGTRKEVDSHWVGGSRYTNNSLLERIAINDRNQLVGEYRIAYNQGVYTSGEDLLDRVTSISRCVGEQCSRPLRLQWGFSSPGAASKGTGRVLDYSNNVRQASVVDSNGHPAQRISLGDADDNPVWSVLDFDLTSHSRHLHSYQEADLNGDGLLDLIVVTATSGGYYLQTIPQTAAGLGARVGIGSLPGDPSAPRGREAPRIYPVDFNADGRMDIAVYLPSTDSWRTYFSEPQVDGRWKLVRVNGFLPSDVSENLSFADVTSNGLPDAIYSRDGQLFVYELQRQQPSADLTEEDINRSRRAYAYKKKSASPRPNSDSYFFGSSIDVDQDGKVDMLGINMSLQVDGGSRDRSCAHKIDFEFLMSVGEGNQKTVSVSTIDGYEEVISRYPPTTSQYLRLVSRELEHVSSMCTEDHFRERLFGPYLADVDGDGLHDLVWAFAEARQWKDNDPQYYFTSIFYKPGKADTTFGEEVEIALGVDALSFELTNVSPDRYSDILITGEDDAKWLMTRDGDAFNRTVWKGASPGRQTRYVDITGSGQLDTLTVVDGKLSVTPGFSKSNDVIVQFETGFGTVSTVAYEPLVLSGRYTPMEGIVNERKYDGEVPQQVCWSSPSGGGCTYPGSMRVVNAGEFYSAINDPFSTVDEATNLQVNRHVPAQELISSMPVVTRVASSSPVANDPESMAGVDYSYEGLKVQAGGRGLLGFNKLTTTDMQTGVSTTTKYRQDWPFIGTPIKTTTRTRHGHLLNKSTSKMGLFGIDENNIAEIRKKAKAGTANLGPLIVYTKEAKDISYDVPMASLTMPGENDVTTDLAESVLSSMETTTKVDSHGNVLEVVAKTLDGSGAELKKQATKNTYFTGEGARLGRLKRAVVTTTVPGVGTATRTADFGYYGYSCAGGQQLTGLLCSERITVNDLKNSQRPEVTSHYYDQFGNKTHTKMGVRVSPMLEYDSKGRFPQATYDVFRKEMGHSDAAPGYSVPAGAAAVKTSEILQRDKFGNAILSRKAVGNGDWVYNVKAATPMGTVFFEGDSTGAFQETRLQRTVLISANWCSKGTVYTSTVTKSGGARATQCVNKVGQATGTYTVGFSGEIIRTSKDYDTLGRVVRVSEPEKNSVPRHSTTTTYDVLGRPLKITHPFRITDSAGQIKGGNAITEYRYGPFTTEVTHSGLADGPDRTTKETRNALGQLTSVLEMGSRSIRYEYDVHGNLERTIDPAGNQATIMYNGLGQKIRMDDLDQGVWTYTYNAHGDLVTQTDANGTVTTNHYDFKGRRTRQEVKPTDGTPAHAVRWDYELAANGLGQVGREVKTDHTGEVEFTRQITFDRLGRASQTVSTFAGVNGQERHHEKITYDQYGRVYQTFDAARTGPQFTYNGVQNEYNERGYLYQVRDAAEGGKPFYTVRGMDARGNVTNMLYGSGEQVSYSFDPITGFLTNISRSTILQEHYEAVWDHLGNMARRQDGLLGGTAETFKYDKHNRLVENTLAGQTVKVEYNSIDNIVKKAGDAYSYHNTKKHAVTKAGNREFEYDRNGNVIKETAGSNTTKTFKYTGNNNVSEITHQGHTSQFFYDTSNRRYKRIDHDIDGNTTITLYLGGVEKVHHADGTVEWKRQVGSIAQVVHTVNSGKANSGRRHYFHKDHLDSITAVTDEGGNVIQRMAFDPWGARRTINNGTWQLGDMTYTSVLASYSKTARPSTHRGYTSHEMLDEVGIIHMNGRIYDASLGRFLQADPFVQAPKEVGSLNRYSYVMNNPMNAVDPSGYFFKRIINAVFKYSGAKATFRAIGSNPMLHAVVSIGLNFVPGCQVICMAAFQAATTYATTGSLNAAFTAGVTSAVSSMAFSAIGGEAFSAGMTKTGAHVARSLAHGMVGGVSSVLQGGKFGHGFASAGLTKAVNVNAMFRGMDMEGVRYDNARIVTAAVIGGTISKGTGGKFANGAITAAMGQALNGNEANLRRLVVTNELRYVASLDGEDALQHFAALSDWDIPDGWSERVTNQIGLRMQREVINELRSYSWEDTVSSINQVAGTNLDSSLDTAGNVFSAALGDVGRRAPSAGVAGVGQLSQVVNLSRNVSAVFNPTGKISYGYNCSSSRCKFFME